MPSQSRGRKKKVQRIYTSKEIATYDYCSLKWWFEQYDPLTQANNDELFAHLDALEQDYGQQASYLPEYIVAEQILIQRGAFIEDDTPWYNKEKQDTDGTIFDRIDEQDGQKQRQLLLLALGTLTLALFVLLIAWIALSLP